MAGHEMYAGALSAAAAILLARWWLAGRNSSARTAAASRRAARRATLRAAWRMGSATAEAGQDPSMAAPCAQRAVREAENLVQGYWRQISPLYLSQDDRHRH
ncbi:hypothetical protein OIE43_42375 [Streptomyces pseudovenezuelae]|uniref:SAV-6107-like HEPN domain-containing protein n=1 Tax=Streptomyces pseudovenezuelae TaxID=67350 RepID=A0ABZ1XAX0_9ACTN|nr:hypothetical protein [Streptomyces pseudovenezuelae]